MSAVIEEHLAEAAVEAPPKSVIDSDVLARLMKVAGEVAGRTVLAVGSGRLAALLKEAGAQQVAVSEAQVEPEGVTAHEGGFPQLTFTEAYDIVLVAAGFEAESDPLPRIARACGAANQEVLAWFPQPARTWFGKRKPVPDETVFHEPAWVARLFEMAGATSSERIKAPEGFIIRAQFKS